MDNFDLKKIAKQINLQKKEDNKVVKKSVGRPRITPKVRVEIRMDKVLKNRFERYDQENGSKGPSAIIIPLVKAFLEEKGYN